MAILLEYNRADFKAWADDNDLVQRYLGMRNRLQKPENDMGYWIKNKKPADLKKFLDEYTSKTQKEKEVKSKGSRVVYNDENWLLLHITTYEAAAKYGSGSVWCITGRYSGEEERGRYWFNKYLDNHYDAYYFLFNKKNPNSDIDAKWALCKLKPEAYSRLGDRGIAGFDIWSQKDDVLSCVPHITPEFPEIGAVGAASINKDGALKGNWSASIHQRRIDSKLELDDTVGATSIKKFGLLYCPFTSVIIDGGITSVGARAFIHSKCERVVFGKNVTKIGDCVLADLPSLTRVTFEGDIDRLVSPTWGCDGVDVVFKGKVGAIGDRPEADEGSAFGDRATVYFDSSKNPAVLEYCKKYDIKYFDAAGSETTFEPNGDGARVVIDSEGE